MKREFIGLLSLLFFAVSLRGQAGEYSQQPIFLKRTTEPVVIDGDLTEVSWFDGSPARDFWQYFPSDSILAPFQTEVYMMFDEKFLYIGAICHSPGTNYVTPSLRRDFRAGGNDNITFVLDPFRDRTNAFVFGINPFGVMREALISNGGNTPERDWNGSWDNKWIGEATIKEEYWSCEMAIPFTTLRFKEGESEWYFNCYRFDTQSNTNSSWNRIPQNQIIMSLGYMGSMVWEEPLKKAGGNVSVIPYITGSYARNFEERLDPEYDPGIGGDAKIAVSSGLNLDLTANPDFSQVEVDEQVIDLSRFELFFPERRQFFLENADLFGGFGTRNINPFFSRRIGIGQDTALDVNISIPILAGARLSGKLDNNWRVGLLNMQTRQEDRSGMPSFNYSVAAFQRKIFSRSNIGFIFVNKQTFDESAPDTSELFSRYNRVAGIEYNLASSDNRLTGKFFFQHSFSPDQGDQPFANGSFLEYRVDRFRLSWEHNFVGKNYNAEVGFVPRTGAYNIAPQAQLYFYPRSSPFNRHGPGLETQVLWQTGFGKADHELRLFWDADLRNSASLRVTLANEETFLFEAFDPSKTDAEPLPDSTLYNYTYLLASFRSDRRKKLAYTLQPVVGEYFNGQRYGMGTSLIYRYQPYGSIELNVNYSYIDLPEPYASTGLFLIGSRIDLTFSKKIFLTTFLQYNDQLKNINVNTRLQWRFAPVSDFFLVYTDNYASDILGVKNRSIVAKLTYWLNI